MQKRQTLIWATCSRTTGRRKPAGARNEPSAASALFQIAGAPWRRQFSSSTLAASRWDGEECPFAGYSFSVFPFSAIPPPARLAAGPNVFDASESRICSENEIAALCVPLDCAGRTGRRMSGQTALPQVSLGLISVADLLRRLSFGRCRHGRRHHGRRRPWTRRTDRT
jgi:hypothetical protein